MSDFSIDEFVSTVGKKGFQDPTRYIISITNPITKSLEQDGVKYCSAVSASGMSFDTTQHWIHGPVRNVAAHEKYQDDISLTFYNDYDMSEYQYFYDWMAKIGDKKFYIKYYKDYVGELVILSYDREGTPRIKVNCDEVYPISLTPFQFAYNKRDQIPTFNVTLTCHPIELSTP